MNFKNLFLITFFYFVYTIRIIISIPINFLLIFFLLFPMCRNRLTKFYKIIHNNINFDDVLNAFEKNMRSKNRVLHYLTISFTLHPIFYIILGIGDCLTHSHFVKWSYVKWCLEHKKSIPYLEIVEILSVKPMVKGNHAIIFYSNEAGVHLWTPYNTQIIYCNELLDNNLEDYIVKYFENKFGNKYINFLFPISFF